MSNMVGNYGSTSLANHDYGIQYLARQNSQDSNPNSTDRPSNLEVTSRLRSSLKRSNYTYSSPNKSTSKNNSGSGEYFMCVGVCVCARARAFVLKLKS
jgi:hypothetical protein